MIVCQCNVITEKAIRSVVGELLDADPLRVITPGLVYMTLGKRGRCCGCFPNAIAVIASEVDRRAGRFEEAPGAVDASAVAA